MIEITATMNQSDLRRIFAALQKISNQVAYWIEVGGGELNRRCAQEYAWDVYQQIQMGSRAYPGYNPMYSVWKRSVGLGDNGFWKLKGDLLKSITHFQHESGWMGGIPGDVMDTGGKSWFGDLDTSPSKPIAMYATVMEFGGDYGEAGYHPKRPAFYPAYLEYGNVKWLRRQQEALRSIEEKWS